MVASGARGHRSRPDRAAGLAVHVTRGCRRSVVPAPGPRRVAARRAGREGDAAPRHPLHARVAGRPSRRQGARRHDGKAPERREDGRRAPGRGGADGRGGSRHDVTDRLGAVTCPTLVASGRYDGIAPPANGEAIAARVRGAQFRVYEGGHTFFAQDPAALPDVIAFLRGDDLSA